MGTVNRILISMLLSIIMPAYLPAQQNPGQAAQSSANQITSKYGNIQGLQDNVFKPLQGQSNMYTVDGTINFPAQISCGTAAKFLEVDMVQGNTGDITDLNVRWDSDLDGTMDSVANLAPMTMNGVISGVCNNGFVSCNPGSWMNCRSYTADYDSITGAFLLNQAVITDLTGCYCVNQSCASALLNSTRILNTSADAVLKAYQNANPSFSLSDIQRPGTVVSYYGQEPTSCFPGNVNSIAGLYNNPNSISTQAQNTAFMQLQNPTGAYSVVMNTYQNQTDPVSTQTCAIDRVVNQQNLTVQDIIEPLGGTGSVSSCGQYCIRIVLGNPTNNWLCAGCTIYEFYYDLYVHKPDKILSATLTQTAYDDHMHIYI